MGIFIKNPGQNRVLQLIKSAAKEILVASGSRSGKTFIFVYAIVLIASKFPRSRHLIARKHFSHVKGAIWLDTLPKVLEVCFPQLAKPGVCTWNNTDFYLTLPNGSEIWIGGLDDKERVDKILGREYLTIFFNECSELSYDSYTTVKSRLAQRCSYVTAKGEVVWAKNMCLLDQNPTSSKHWSKLLFVDKVDPETREAVKKPERYAFGKIHPSENLDNISEDYLEHLESLPPAKRKRFLDGEWSEGTEYALWQQETINRTRLRVDQQPESFRRIVVAVDPAVTAKDTSDETGIIVAGIGWDYHLYVLQDLTGVYTPSEWAKAAVLAYDTWQADRVVGEVNQGGDMVEAMIRTVSPLIPFTGVFATRNKFTRAEPVAALYEIGRAHHIGLFPDLEEQQTLWEGKKGEKSPNNIDALVWAAADLFPDIGTHSMPQGNFAKAMRGELSL